MIIIYSYHWKRKKKFRSEISDDHIEYCILHSEKLKDKKWKDAFNALSKIPPSGRELKVVYKEYYKEESKHIKIITAFWLD